MSLSRAPAKYDQRDQDRLRADLDRMNGESRKQGQDVEIAGAERLILASANGSRWEIVVADDGSISAAAL